MLLETMVFFGYAGGESANFYSCVVQGLYGNPVGFFLRYSYVGVMSLYPAGPC